MVGERVPSIELVSSQDDSFTMKADLFCHFKVIFVPPPPKIFRKKSSHFPYKWHFALNMTSLI